MVPFWLLTIVRQYLGDLKGDHHFGDHPYAHMLTCMHVCMHACMSISLWFLMLHASIACAALQALGSHRHQPAEEEVVNLLGNTSRTGARPGPRNTIFDRRCHIDVDSKSWAPEHGLASCIFQPPPNNNGKKQQCDVCQGLLVVLAVVELQGAIALAVVLACSKQLQATLGADTVDDTTPT